MALSNVHLTPQLIQAVRDSIDILDIAAPHTRLEKKGTRWVGLCPFHKEKTPSFSVDPTQGLYYCFGCGAGGDAIRLHMLTTGDDFPAAIESLARLNGIPLPTSGGARSSDGPDLGAVLEAAAELFTGELAKASRPREYLAQRKIPAEVIEKFGLGYAPKSFDFLLERLSSRFERKDLVSAGLLSTKDEGDRARAWDRFRDRLMFPIRNGSGRLVGFGGRTLGDDRAKYINTAETDRFQKRTLLYGLDLARRSAREEGTLLLVEGYFDVIAAVASGIEWAVASMGTALAPDQARLLSRYAEEVVIGYDGDRAGNEACRRALPILLARGLAVRRMEMGDGEDPDTVRLDEGEEAVRRRVDASTDFVASELDRILPGHDPDPPTVARVAKEVRELLGPIPDPVLRFGYGRRAADRLGMPPDLLFQRHQPRSAGEAAAPRTVRKREVTSLEERALQLLMSGEIALPAAADLPPVDVFLDGICGNIYGHFLDLYREGTAPPEAGAVLSALSGQGEELDRIARILLEGESCSEKLGELEEALRRLNRRWQQNRLRRLALEINEAQRQGDADRLETLVEEKTSISRVLHEVEPGPQTL
ncbi:MAG: DNA primase [Acidobacteriota bacterium]|nr:DNA primase [Acidobacteriota bacterium]